MTPEEEQLLNDLGERAANRILELEAENVKLREALEICLKELMYQSTTGHWWIWARSNEAVPERLMELRKLLETKP